MPTGRGQDAFTCPRRCGCANGISYLVSCQDFPDMITPGERFPRHQAGRRGADALRIRPPRPLRRPITPAGANSASYRATEQSREPIVLSTGAPRGAERRHLSRRIPAGKRCLHARLTAPGRHDIVGGWRGARWGVRPRYGPVAVGSAGRGNPGNLAARPRHPSAPGRRDARQVSGAAVLPRGIPVREMTRCVVAYRQSRCRNMP
jgi:hypothetical protein